MLIVILTSWLAFMWWFSPPTAEQYVLRLPGNPCPPGYSTVVPAEDDVAEIND